MRRILIWLDIDLPRILCTSVVGVMFAVKAYDVSITMPSVLACIAVWTVPVLLMTFAIVSVAMGVLLRISAPKVDLLAGEQLLHAVSARLVPPSGSSDRLRPTWGVLKVTTSRLLFSAADLAINIPAASIQSVQHKSALFGIVRWILVRHEDGVVCLAVNFPRLLADELRLVVNASRPEQSK